MSDSVDGFDRAPDRYSSQGRETVDRMRDLCRENAFKLSVKLGLVPCDHTLIDRIGDFIFSTACETHAMKYSDRLGLKDSIDVDSQKMKWWTKMAHHASGLDDDPRSNRPGFKPYEEK